MPDAKLLRILLFLARCGYACLYLPSVCVTIVERVHLRNARTKSAYLQIAIYIHRQKTSVFTETRALKNCSLVQLWLLRHGDDDNNDDDDQYSRSSIVVRNELKHVCIMYNKEAICVRLLTPPPTPCRRCRRLEIISSVRATKLQLRWRGFVKTGTGVNFIIAAFAVSFRALMSLLLLLCGTNFVPVVKGQRRMKTNEKKQTHCS